MELYATIHPQWVLSDMPDVPVVIPATAWMRVTQNVPAHLTRRGIDCGAYSAATKSGYPFSCDEYVQWLRGMRPEWAATFDFPCVPEHCWPGLPDVNVTPERVTTHLSWGMALMFWHQYKHESWAWTPTIQGPSIEDYRQNARTLAPLIAEMQSHYRSAGNAHFRVGIGGLVRRPVREIEQIVDAVHAIVPDVPLHLWGVSVRSAGAQLPNAVSADTAAWSARRGTDIQRQKDSGLSQRRYAWSIQYPLYRARWDQAIGRLTKRATPFQPALF